MTERRVMPGYFLATAGMTPEQRQVWWNENGGKAGDSRHMQGKRPAVGQWKQCSCGRDFQLTPWNVQNRHYLCGKCKRERYGRRHVA